MTIAVLTASTILFLGIIFANVAFPNTQTSLNAAGENDHVVLGQHHCGERHRNPYAWLSYRTLMSIELSPAVFSDTSIICGLTSPFIGPIRRLAIRE
jgi:hypothetical protein